MDKELIDHITEQLNAHQEPYSDGAWERFALQEEKKKRGFIYWPLWSAAALLLLSAGLYFGLTNSEIKNNTAVVKPKKELKEPSFENTEVAKTKETNPLKNQNSSEARKEFVDKNISEQSESVRNENFVVVEDQNTATNDISFTRNDNQLASTIYGNTLLSNSDNRKFSNIIEKKKPVQKLSFEDLLARDSKKQPTIAAKKNSESKWEPGVYVAPAMGNDNKVNMNYGFSLAYSVAKKVSISSGIAYSALSSTGQPATQSPSAAMDASASSSIIYSAKPQSSTSKSLESVNASLGGINIPLEVRYSFSDKFYTGIGVSAFAVLNSKQQNNYIVNQFENRSFTNAMGVLEQKTLIVQEKASESIPESSVDPDKYIGFYNFSLGYKQKISTKKNISIEPFLRLPMKTFSSENLNLTNGGVRLKLDF